MAVIGGTGSLAGPLVAAVLLTLLQYLDALDPGHPDATADTIQSYQEDIYGLAIILVVIFAPRGLAGLWRRRGGGEGGAVSLLQVRNVTKRFGGLTAVDDVSFDVFEGTIKALIGPNGAGKSTLFNALTGFDRPDDGSVLFDGAELVGRRPRDTVRAGVARTFQNTQLFDEMTAGENVMVGRQAHQRRGFTAAMLRLPAALAEDREARDEAGRLLRLIGIEEWVDTPAADLPAGIRRLVEIARALATGPRLLLLDEPAAGLNATEARELVQTLFRVRDAGITVVIVEHHMGLVMDVSDEIVVLDRGAKIAEGPPRMIQKDPAVIAAYLGEETDDDD